MAWSRDLALSSIRINLIFQSFIFFILKSYIPQSQLQPLLPPSSPSYLPCLFLQHFLSPPSGPGLVEVRALSNTSASSQPIAVHVRSTDVSSANQCIWKTFCTSQRLQPAKQVRFIQQT